MAQRRDSHDHHRNQERRDQCCLGPHAHTPDQKVKDDYTEAMKILDRISAGTIALTAAGIEAPNVQGTGVQITDRERLLTQDNMTGFI